MKITREYLESIFYKEKKYFNSAHAKRKGCTWYMFLSDRSDGKTFDCKIQSIIDFITNDYAHLYIRRYDTEITTIMKQTFFNKLIRKYPIIDKLIDIKYDDIGVLAKKKEESNYRYMTYILPLSMSGKLKSQIEDERIMFIDFDEYIPLDGRYLKDEMNYCCSLYRTIDRDRDVVQFSFLGNKITSFNPAFDFWDLKLEITGEKLRTYKEDTICVQIYKSSELHEERKKSNFYKSIQGTTYDDFFNGNVLNQAEIIKMNIDDAKFYVSFKTNRGEGSIWLKNNYYIVSNKKYGQDILITDTTYNIDRPCINCMAGNVSSVFKTAFRFNLIAYTSERAFYIFEPILRKINLK